jgi:hypothetical protein
MAGSTGGPDHRWTVHTVGYLYELLDADQRTIVEYHRHPIGRSLATFPHMHAGSHTSSFDLTKAHLPTVRVGLIDVLRMAVTDLGVAPLRSDWRTVLDEADDTIGD